jgi:PTH1 family peptidyl-tRNA hydrolase
VDYLSDVLGVSVNRAKFNALCGDAQLGPYRVLLMKPQTFMNASGDAIRAAADFYKIPPENILVLVDDIYQDAGRMRVRADGSHGGHNGLRSIEGHIGAKYPRIRLGVGQKPSPQYDLAAWVLGVMPKEDIAKLVTCFPLLRDAAEKIFAGKTADAMGICNGHRPSDAKTEKTE